MTKKKSNLFSNKKISNPFGFNVKSNVSSNKKISNPLGLTGKSTLGIKMPPMADPFKNMQKATRALDKQINSSMKNIGKITTPTYRQYMPKRESIMPRQIQPRQVHSIRPIMSNQRQYPKIPSLMDILEKIEKKRVDKINQDRLIETRRRQNLTDAIKQNAINYSRVPRYDFELRRQVSNIHEELSNQTKRITNVEKQVVEVKDDLTLIKEKITTLEDYKRTLQEGVTQLLEIKDNLDPLVFTETLNNLLLEKQKTDEEISKITLELQKVVEQQKKDIPFTKTMKRLLDDNRFNDQVL